MKKWQLDRFELSIIWFSGGYQLLALTNTLSRPGSRVCGIRTNPFGSNQVRTVPN